MTQEQFNQMMAEYERTKNPVPDNTPADWEAPAVQWARDNGLLAGDGSGNLMLHSNMTRAQFLVMLKKYHEKKAKFGEDVKEKYFSTTRTHRNARFCISFSSSQGKKKPRKCLKIKAFGAFLNGKSLQSRYFKFSIGFPHLAQRPFWAAPLLRRSSVLPKAKPRRRANSLRPSNLKNPRYPKKKHLLCRCFFFGAGEGNRTLVFSLGS